MSIYTTQILGFRAALRSAGPSQNGLDDFFPQYEERGQGMESFRYGFVSPRSFSFADDLFASEFLQVVGCHARGIHALLRSDDRIYLCGKVSDTESVRGHSQFDHSLDHRTYPGFVGIDASDLRFSHTGRSGQIVQLNIGDAGDVNAVHGIQKPVKDILQVRDDLSEPIQETAARQHSGIVGNDLDPEGAFAFGITLGGDLSEVDLEHRQVKSGCADRPIR